MTDDASDGPPDLATGATLGDVLAWLRTSAGLSGTELARRAGTNQTKISRIETGIGAPPTAAEVERLARASGADDDLVRRLIAESERLRDSTSDWHQGRAAHAPRQSDFEQAEAAAHNFKIFQPTVVIGLLQTSGYAAAVLSALQTVMAEPGHPPSAQAVHEAVSVRVHRQAILLDPGRHFDLVMSEAVLSNRLCPPEEMPAQINQIRRLAGRPNVTVAIIPADSPLPVPPFHGFSLMDDRDLFVDLFDTAIDKHDRLSARAYGRVFEALKDRATEVIDPILDRYFEDYLGRLRPTG
jgi:transcriptional regulator with XRE-family HTH domain